MPVQTRSQPRATPGDESSLARALVGALRLAWFALLGGLAVLGDVLAGHSRPVQVVATVMLWLGWSLTFLALLVPSTVTLTAARLAVPVSVVVYAWATVEGAGALAAVLAAVGLLASVLVLSAEVGEVFVQASAYGEERRLPLRAPGPMLPVVAIAWALLVAAVVAGPLLLAARAYVAGALVSAAAAVLVGVLSRRFHQLSRRWLVVVPAGLVLHDHTVLAETAMFPRAQVRGCALALADTEAADLTGGALGHALELSLAEAATVVLARTPSHPGGRALHARAVLLAPSRPGRAIAIVNR